MDKKNLKTKLTDLQFQVTQNCGTEKPFYNLYWNNKDAGIYVDIVTEEPLFCSIHKYDSGTGWPSFYLPIKEDTSYYILPNKINKNIYSNKELFSELEKFYTNQVYQKKFEEDKMDYIKKYIYNADSNIDSASWIGGNSRNLIISLRR